MPRPSTRAAILGLSLLPLGAQSADDPAPPARPQVPPVNRVHDPSLFQDKKQFYLFSTGRGVPIRTSHDLVHWERAGSVIPDGVPAWAKAAIPNARDLWAPDISWWADEWRLYYSVSSFGSQRSAIGLATNRAIDPANPAYRWEDRGLVIDSIPGRDDFNAIDPNVVPNSSDDIIRDPKRPWIWLSFGSFWGGIKIVGLDMNTGKPNPDRWGPPKTIAARPGDHAIEAPFLYHKDGWFYLFASIDHCCRGADSDYKVIAGRSRTADGTYLDLAGRPMTEGGGSPVLAGSGPIRGPGHNCVLRLVNGAEVFVHHFYDATAQGTPKLQVRHLVWGTDGFPLAGEVVNDTINQPFVARSTIDRRSVARRWAYSSDFGDPKPIRLLDSGTIEGERPGATWTVRDRSLVLDWGEGRRDNCVVAPDGRSFVGRGQDHTVVRGTAEPD